MSNEPERSLDELLKAYAQKRRAEPGAPPEMPSATRRLLQAEVNRTFRKQGESSSWFAELSGLWRRLAWGGSILAVLVVGSLILFRPQKVSPNRFELAQQKTEKALTRQQTKSAPEANAPATSDATRRNDVSFNANGVSPARNNEPAVGEKSVQSLAAKSEKQVEMAKSDTAGPSPAAPIATAGSRALGPLSSSPSGNEQPGEPAAMRRYGLTLQRNAEPSAPPLSAPTPPEKPGAAMARAPATATEEAKAADKRSAGAADLARLRESKPVAETLPTTLSTLPAAPPALADSKAPKVSAQENHNASPVTAARLDAVSIPPGAKAANYALTQDAQTRGMTDSNSNAVGLYFSQGAVRARYRQNFNSPPMPNVLQTFEIQRDHANVRVIDADGSIYEGTIQTVATTADSERAAIRREALIGRVEPGKAKNQAARAQSDEATPLVNFQSAPGELESFSFNAVGTNRSLNQRVVFMGSFQAATNIVFAGSGGSLGRGGFGGGGIGRPSQALPKAPSSNVGIPAQTAASQSPPPQVGLQGGTSSAFAPVLLRNQAQPLANGRIEGKAVIGEGKELKIEAIQINR